MSGDLALLIEIAARNELLKSQGYDAAKEFARRVDEEIAKNSLRGRPAQVNRLTPAPGTTPESLVVVTGLSGSGKSYVDKVLEDMGYFCVDNLPLEMLEPLLSARARPPGRHHPRRAQPDFAARFPEILAGCARVPGTRLLFLDASEESLIRRFSETRRPHPLPAPPLLRRCGASARCSRRSARSPTSSSTRRR